MEQGLTYIIPFYTLLIALLWIWMTWSVISLRRKHYVSIHSNGHEDLKMTIRAHANFCETAPLGLLCLYIASTQTSLPYLLHLWGACLVIGRTLHFVGLSKTVGKSNGRFYGMILTMISILGSSLTAFYYSL